MNDLAQKLLQAINPTEAVENFYKRVLSGEKKKLGATTGFDFLDGRTNGLEKQTFWVIGGASGVGKTSLVSQMVLNASKDERTIYFLFESNKIKLLTRLISQQTNIPTSKIEKQDLTESEKDKVLEVAEKLSKRIIIIDDGAFNSTKNIRIALETISNANISFGIVVIDYLQLLRNEGKNEYDTLRTVTSDCQTLSKDFNTNLIGISSLSNEQIGIDKINYAKFKGSGDITYSADVALLIQRDKNNEKDKTIIQMVIAKNRYGEDFGATLLHFIPQTQSVIEFGEKTKEIQQQNFDVNNFIG